MTLQTTAVRGNGTMWYWPENGEVVTASPTVVCIWRDQASVNTTEGLVAGPYVPDPKIRTEQQLVDLYNQWICDGRPK